MKQRLILFIISIFAFTTLSYAQQKYIVQGVVKEGNKPLGLTKIYANDSTGTSIARAITLEDGIFKLNLTEGKYTLLFTKTGYKSNKKIIIINGADLEIGTIFLREGEEIEAAGISANSLLTRSNDRLTYDVSKDPDRFKLNMTAMMQKIPELKLAAKDGKLEYGMNKVSKILINDEENGLINVKRQYVMEFIQAHYMKKVELVLPGSLEYNNSEPILLITLSKALPYGVAGSINAQADTKHSYSPAVDMVTNTPIMGVSANYSYDYAGKNPLTDRHIREDENGQSWDMSTTNWSSSQSHNIGAGIFRSFADEKLNFQARFNTNVSDTHAASESFLNGIQDERSDIYNHSPFALSAYISLSGRFGKPARNGRPMNVWSLKYNYSNNASESNSQYAISNTLSSSEDNRSQHRLEASMDLRDFTIGNFRSKLALRSGWYARHFFTSNVYNDDLNGSDYQQNIIFASASTLGNITRELSFIVQMLAEYYSNSGIFTNSAISTTPLDYGEFSLVPNIGLSYKKFTLNFSRSLRRPGAEQLNPYRDTRSPHTTRVGNPLLKGDATNAFSLTFRPRLDARWISMLNFSASYSFSNNTISSYITANPDGTAIQSYCNLGQSQNLSASASASFNPTKQLSISPSASINRSYITLPNSTTNVNTHPRFFLSIKWRPSIFELYCTSSLAPSLLSAQSQKIILEPTINLSLSRYFAKPKIGISINVNDVIHSGGTKESFLKMGSFTQHNYIQRLGRNFSFSIYWRIGKFQNRLESAEIKAYDM